MIQDLKILKDDQVIEIVCEHLSDYIFNNKMNP